MTRPASYEIRRQLNERGENELDEVVASNCFFHLERMDELTWWAGITLPDGTNIHLNFRTRPSKDRPLDGGIVCEVDEVRKAKRRKR